MANTRGVSTSRIKQEESSESDENDISYFEDLSYYDSIYSSSEDEESYKVSDVWKIILPNTDIKHQIFPYTFNAGLSNINLSSNERSIKFYELFMNEKIIEYITQQTNVYAAQSLAGKTISKSCRLRLWKDTNTGEMKKFLGLLLWMGLVKYPKLSDYWSTHPIYKNDIAPQTMSRNRFELLLSMWHFSNNEEGNGDQLHKINSLKDMLEELYQYYNIPGEYLCIDETIVPFRGQLSFRQYMRRKRHKYGVKLYKIADTTGYTYSIQIYKGKSEGSQGNVSLSTDIVLKLGEKYLGEGRTFTTDNYYTSIELAEHLLERSTHLIGTLRTNRKRIPKEVVNKKLSQNEIIGMHNEKGIVVAKWKDKRDVLMLSTKHATEITSIGKKNYKQEEIFKPKIVQDYNIGKTGIDLSDQYSSYSSAVRKSVKWYRKVAMELIFGTTVVNAHIIYNKIADKKVSITTFREFLVESLLNCDKSHQKPAARNPKKHTLETVRDVDKRNRKLRKRCASCYAKNREKFGSRKADKASVTPRVASYCAQCPGKPAMCASCFVNMHE
ncbi:piggyBac transposable element-derived protein 4-like [Centruroides sculpturatus]|uniref:piggyBac transposable element-derived protein 4-like n=1 Tax=Centruroides sculpturatus TaxID=218467 RepID=UPI000C6DAE20|nr:piggyBac transposable element-derived protein 4-like [Centruroides sculpturatus]